MTEDAKIEEVAIDEIVDAPAAEETVPQAKKKNKKKLPIVLGVVVVVLVVAGAGFFMWHEQPSFCNAICHTPMDAYAETYLDGTYDKYGNEMTDEASKKAMMAYAHATNEEKTTNCLGCHVPTMGEQISEGMNWISGSYEVAGENANGQLILETRELSDLVAARGVSEDEFCLKSGCHVTDSGAVMTRDDLVAATAEYDRNPHQSKHGDKACSECHQAHAQSVNRCSECHEDAPIPEGWLSVSDAKKIQTV